MKHSQDIIMDITTMEDIKRLKDNSNIKYINIDITKTNLDVIYYLIENGEKYLYSEKELDKNGYIYVPYNIFKEAQLVILEVINKIPASFNEIEIARYLYITIGKNIGYDINILPDKNETFNLKNVSICNNIWASIYYGKGTNSSLTKLYFYLCNLMNINCKLIITSKIGYQKNLLTIQNREMITDITQDIPYIQANCKTRNFIGFNNDIELDKKIGYIKNDYTESLIEKSLQNINYNEEILEEILNQTSKIININNIKPMELGIIYENIFSNYFPNYEIKIYNLYRNNYPEKEHFIIMNHHNTFYSFNYTKNMFVEIAEQDIIKNIENKKIGIYLNEKIPFITNKTRRQFT